MIERTSLDAEKVHQETERVIQKLREVGEESLAVIDRLNNVVKELEKKVGEADDRRV